MTDEEELAAFIVLATTMLGELEDAMHDTEVLALSELFATQRVRTANFLETSEPRAASEAGRRRRLTQAVRRLTPSHPGRNGGGGRLTPSPRCLLFKRRNAFRRRFFVSRRANATHLTYYGRDRST